MPVTHGVTGPSPVRTAKKPSEFGRLFCCGFCLSASNVVKMWQKIIPDISVTKIGRVLKELLNDGYIGKIGVGRATAYVKL